MEDLKDLDKELLFTSQEHKLVGSSVREQYIDRFYTPIAIQMGYGIKEVDELRKMYKIFDSFGVFWEGADRLGIESLYFSPVNLETGETIFDPKPVKGELRLKESYETDHRWRTLYLDPEWEMLQDQD